MKTKILIAFLIVTLVSILKISAQTPAFPSAEGDGMYTTGGRGGNVLYVTKLTDDGSVGTLRWAINQTGARIIMFKVAGTIKLNSELRIKNGNVTIAGQSAPGDGVCLKDYTVVVQANNVIIRFMRFRLGDEAALANPTVDFSGADAIWGRNQTDIIIDHCSMSWCIDECASFYDNKRFTMQWCILAESLRNSVHGKGTHGYGGIWGGSPATFHHNVLAFHDSRNPRFNGSRYSGKPADERVNFTNNVIYNWGSNSGYAGEGGSHNMLNNYYRSGPGTKTTSGNNYRIFQPNPNTAVTPNVWGRFHLSGNTMLNRISTTTNNWEGFQPNPAPGPDSIRVFTRFNMPYLRLQSADSAFLSVMEYGGASLKRDSVDKRVIKNIRNGTVSVTLGSNGSTGGFIDSQKDVGGWPEYIFDPNSVSVDTDGDGMPDNWEITKGLNPNDAADGKTTTLDGGYTNVEVYLNELAQPVVDNQYMDAPTRVKSVNAVPFTIFPNPVKNGIVTLSASNTIKKVEIYSLNGVLLQTHSTNDDKINLNVGGLGSGTYMVSATLGSGLKLNKVLIKQ